MCWFITFTVTPFSTIFLMLSARILSTIGMPLGISSLLFLYFHLTGSHQISQSEMRFYCVSHTEQQKNNNNWWQLKYILYFIYHKNSSNSVHSHHLKNNTSSEIGLSVHIFKFFTVNARFHSETLIFSAQSWRKRNWAIWIRRTIQRNKYSHVCLFESTSAVHIATI